MRWLLSFAAVGFMLGCGGNHKSDAVNDSNSGGASGLGGSGADTITVHAGGAGGSCRRDVTLQAVVLGEPPPFDLVIVADHSQSLAWSKDDLSSGLHDLLSHVKGRAVRVFLLTPTQYGASSAAARYPLSGSSVVAWKDPVTGAVYEDAMTEYAQTCKDRIGNVISCPNPPVDLEYSIHGEWKFVMPEPIAVLTPTMTDAQFATEQAAVANAILAIGGTGSPNEQPLCTLSRYVRQDPSLLPENVVMLVITDEDDVSKPDACLLSFDAEEHPMEHMASTETPCSSNCDAYWYRMSGGTVEQVLYPITCAGFDDAGTMIPGTEQTSTATDSSSCAGIVSGATCTEQQKASAQKWCPTGLKLTACHTSCMSSSSVCSIQLTKNATACTSAFTYNGASYSNMSDYCSKLGKGFQNCQIEGVNITTMVTGNTWSATQTLTPVAPGTTTVDIGHYFSTKRAAAFAPGKSLLEGILLDSSFSCPLGGGQSYATNIESVIADPTHVFPLCQSYAPALDGVLGFAQALVQTKYTLTLKDDEHVTSVVIIGKDGTERTLDTGSYSVNEATGVLDINPSALHGNDANLRVEVTSDCRPIVR
ncbi:MAG TPA: hypothetical protein VFK05_31290 [Polyangiaceae bacterium]|nr:hypothetical protein [Polyangiaceae bacterium]